MKTWEIEVRRPWDDRAIAEMVERAAASQRLTISLRAGLQKYPGCIHWHFKMNGKSGTIEATMWPSRQRVWLSVQTGRNAEWIKEAVGLMINDLHQTLRVPLGTDRKH